MSKYDRELREKIIKLLDYRNLPGILEEVENDLIVREQFVEKLISIQEAIYHLDHLLESEWDIINSRLHGKWEAIYDSLRGVGIEEDQFNEYCRHIYKYQKHELEQRRNKSLLRLSMEYFYFYKSCDVKLLRRLIYDRYPALKSTMTLADWRWFDLVTEVNDDVMDVYEDLETNNGNRFLLSIERYGLLKTFKIYQSFLEEIGNAFHLKNKTRTIHPIIRELTVNELKRTLELLELRKSEIIARPITVGAFDSI